jgi:2-C-methyl-D-erythritol 4-phosphate cytidylyltransferase / 2-C-methyl-D-erythritol 2,4-cyclodiphosphate synthase
VSVAALIVAAGRGTRASGATDVPKQYVRLGASTVVQRSIAAFCESGIADRVVAVVHPGDRALFAASVTPSLVLGAAIDGGPTRQQSVRLGLEALAAYGPDIVLIHDAARPFVTRPVIERVVAAIGTGRGAVAAIAVADTLKRANAAGVITGTVERARLWRAQTPQGFRFAEILDAHRRAFHAGIDGFTDDAALAEWAGMTVCVVEGGDRNVKLTTAEDITMAQALTGGGAARTAAETRTGTGFDVHRFAPGDGVWLCGVKLPHTARLEGHSDADVALHALTDALLGAIGAGDIGQHFPPSDMRWKDASSDIFLQHAAGLIRDRGGRIVNVDVTILAEAPRVGPHREVMCARLAEILGIERSRVSVKATTTEGLGFTGRREGIAAMASASVELRIAALADNHQTAN